MSTAAMIIRLFLISLLVAGLSILGLHETTFHLKLWGIRSSFVRSAVEALSFALICCPIAFFYAIRPLLASRSKSSDAQIREGEALYKSLVELSPDGIMVLSNGKINFCNSAFARILGAKDATEIIGRAELEFIPASFHEAVLDGQDRVLTNDVFDTQEIAVSRVDGTIVTAERTITAISWQGQMAFLVLTRNITERDKHERWLRSIVESLQEGFVLYDSESRIVMWNEKWLKFHPAVRDDLKIGMTFEQFVRAAVARGLFPEATGQEEAFIAERVARHRDPHDPIIRHRPDGRWYIINEVRTDDGGIFALNIDITDLKEAETAAQDARERAESADRSKSEFLANMSHELRTPLNAVIGFSELIKRQSQLNISAESVGGYVDAIHSSGQHLLGLINDILDFSKADAGKLKLRDERVDLADLFKAVLVQIEHSANEAELLLSFPCLDHLPVVRGDELRLSQILLNLLSNAVKFTPRGGEVRVSVAPTNDGGVEITVTDTGVGMSDAELTKLGQPFRQFQTAYSRNHRGTGLGVSLSQALAELHGGKLHFVSERDKGTMVTLKLPADRVLQSRLQAPRPLAT